MDENFLLSTKTGQRLYHQYARDLPIIDYHNHLSLQELSADQNYPDLAALWLTSDPYKHRAMRICGVNEQYITGGASHEEKFAAWMDTLPRLAGNPLYDWSVLEMQRVFDICLEPGITDVHWLWQQTGKMLTDPDFKPTALLRRFGVEYASPCAQITDDLTPFAAQPFLSPSLRGDTIVACAPDTCDALEQLTGIHIHSLQNYIDAVCARTAAFATAGCRFADHALDNGFRYCPEDGKNEARFAFLRQGGALTIGEKQHLESAILRLLAQEYATRGWAMQLHIGAQRTTSSRLRALAGPAGGFAGIGGGCDVHSLTSMLNDFEQTVSGMPRIILYTLNPADNAVMAVLSGSYSQDGVAGKVQQGPAWWWCDHLYGMRQVFESISAYGVLSVSIGMTTDSRSVLSMVRHEYFRRALCGWMGEKAERGELPNREALLGEIVTNVCYRNAKRVVEYG